MSSTKEKRNADMASEIFIETPLIASDPLEEIIGVPVFLKMENCQPSGSFKLRGLSRMVKSFQEKRSCFSKLKSKAVNNGYLEVVSSSGGNCGMAVGYTARKLGVKAHLVVPTRTSKEVIESIQKLGADVSVYGKFWDESNEKALEIAEQRGSAYIHPAEHPVIWTGHATMISEIQKQLPLRWPKPGAVIASVGYGGLLLGVLQGLDEAGWDDVPVIAMETLGAHSFHEAVKAGKVVTLPELTSIATTLSAAKVSEKLMEYLDKRGRIFSEVITDREAVNACLRFADDHRVIVEPSCGATLAAIYGRVITQMVKEGKFSLDGPVIVIVCGGSGVHLEQLQRWKEMFEL